MMSKISWVLKLHFDDMIGDCQSQHQELIITHSTLAGWCEERPLGCGPGERSMIPLSGIHRAWLMF